jgi:hypothetical protein
MDADPQMIAALIEVWLIVDDTRIAPVGEMLSE